MVVLPSEAKRFIFKHVVVERLFASGEKWGIVLSNRFPEKIRIFDTTLRDGEQTPRVSSTPRKNIRIGKRLDAIGAVQPHFLPISHKAHKTTIVLATRRHGHSD